MDNSGLFRDIFQDYKKPEKDIVGQLSDLWGEYSAWRDADPLFGANSKNPFQFDPVPLAGVVSPKNAVKFYEAIRNKFNQGNKYWEQAFKDYLSWEESNKLFRSSVKNFPENFAEFRKETRPTKGIQANFIDPTTSREPDFEHYNIWEPAYDPKYAGEYEMKDYLGAPNQITNDIYGTDYRFNRGIFSSGLQEGDEIYRGTSTGTYELGKKYPRELGPHASTLPEVAEGFASPNRGTELGGQLVKSLWEGGGDGLYLKDLGHFSIPNAVDNIIDNNILPKRYLDELKDLKLRYNDAKRVISWDADPLENALNASASQEFGKILQNAGYDHINYMNTHEGPGHISTIPLYPYKFKEVENTYFPSRAVTSRIGDLNSQQEASLISAKEKYDAILRDLDLELNPMPKNPLPSEYYVQEGFQDNPQKEFIDLADLLSKYGLWK